MRFNVSLKDLFKSEAKLKLIKFLLSHEATMSEREIASILKISHMSVNRAMQELAELNLVNYVKAGKSHLWKVNRQSYVYKILEKVIKDAESLIDARGELRKMVLKSLPLQSIEKIILFGSIATNETKPDSDIDLFILVKDVQSKNKLEKCLEELSLECLDAFGNRLAPYVLTQQQLHQKQGLDVIKAVNRGIQFYPDIKAKL